MQDDTLLFSLVAVSPESAEAGFLASSVTIDFGVFVENASVQPLFPKNKVGKAIAVMAEGTYHLKRTLPDGTVKYRPVTFTKEDIERVAKTQPRDVPFNYDHKKGMGRDGVKGWLRFGEGFSTLGTLQTKTGPKTALFATPELGEEALGLVADGIYRDVSVEYREADGVLTGIALTSYPVMRNLQFGEVEDEAVSPEVTTDTAPQTQEPAAEVELSDPTPGEAMDLTTLTDEQRKTLLKDLLGASGIDLNQIVKLGEDLEQAKADAQAARHETLVTKTEGAVQAALGSTFYGMTDELATSVVDALVWADENSELKFGEEGGAPDLKTTVLSLLGVIAKNGKQIKILGGATPGKAEDGTELFGEVENDPAEIEKEDTDLNPTRVKSIVDMAKRLL